MIDEKDATPPVEVVKPADGGICKVCGFVGCAEDVHVLVKFIDDAVLNGKHFRPGQTAIVGLAAHQALANAIGEIKALGGVSKNEE